MNNSQNFFYHFGHISTILLLLIYFILVFIERSYLKRNLSKICELAFDNNNYLIYAELSGDFPLGDSRQPTYKSLRPFDLVS